jgi:hypothetical protein
MIDAFYDSFACTALFRKLRIPGSPRETVDPRPANLFWADLGLEVIAHAREALTEIQKIALAGALKTAFSEMVKAKPKMKNSENERDLETFMSEWSSCTKP